MKAGRVEIRLRRRGRATLGTLVWLCVDVESTTTARVNCFSELFSTAEHALSDAQIIMIRSSIALLLALAVGSCSAFALLPAHSNPTRRALLLRQTPSLAKALRMQEAEDDDVPAADGVASPEEGVTPSSGDRDDISGSSFTVQAPMTVLPGFEGFKGFDFSGSQSIPTPARGEAGLNEQGYEPYSKEKADKVTDSTYLIGLGAAAVASVALSVLNMASSS